MPSSFEIVIDEILRPPYYFANDSIDRKDLLYLSDLDESDSFVRKYICGADIAES
jgi:hypothetical protein